MKRSRLSYDEWQCIISKDILGKRVNSELLNGYIGLIDIKEVSKAQTWKFNGEDIIVYPYGTIVVDEMDELEDALSKRDIIQEQYNFAIEKNNRL